MTDVARAAQLLGRSSYVLLTTFRRDGRPVPTPVWVAPLDGRDGTRLVLVTEDTTGKVKRLRREPRVLLAPCSVRGRAYGRPVDATAALLPEAEVAAAERALATKHGVLFRVFDGVEGLLRRSGRMTGHRVAVGLTVTG